MAGVLLALAVDPRGAGAQGACLDLAGEWSVTVTIQGSCCLLGSCTPLPSGAFGRVSFAQDGCRVCAAALPGPPQCGVATSDSLDLTGPLVECVNGTALSNHFRVSGPASASEFHVTGSGSAECEVQGYVATCTAESLTIDGSRAATGICGDGHVDPGEDCDSGSPQGGLDCTAACRRPSCAELVAFRIADAIVCSGGGCVMEADFTPNFALPLAETARHCGYDHFNWANVIVRDDMVQRCLETASSACDGLRTRTGTLPTTLDPVLGGIRPYVDPPPGGYDYLGPFPNQDDFPWYWDEQFPFGNIGGRLDDGRDITGTSALLFFDSPGSSAGDVVDVTTYLAGVQAGGSGAAIDGEGVMFRWRFTGGSNDIVRRSALSNPPNTGRIELLGVFAFRDSTRQELAALAAAGVLPPTAELECGADRDCSDRNECTDDACTAGYCQYTSNTAPCTDGNECTTSDTCGPGGCIPGRPLTISDAATSLSRAAKPRPACASKARHARKITERVVQARKPLVKAAKNPSKLDKLLGLTRKALATSEKVLAKFRLKQKLPPDCQSVLDYLVGEAIQQVRCLEAAEPQSAASPNAGHLTRK